MATTTYPLRLDADLLRKAKKQAKIERRTLASLLRFLLDQHLAGKKAQS